MERRFASVDYFAVLGVPASADDGEIRSAFRKLAVIHHPDKATYNKEEAKRTFQGIAEAYEVLKDSELRARYLRVRQGGGRAKDSSGRPQGNRSSGSGSIASMRRAAMAAAREQELEEERARERDFVERERALQRNYEELKSTIKTRLLSDSGSQDDTNWKQWWSEQIGSKWMNEKWEEYLPDVGGSSGVQELLLRDLQHEVREDRDRRAIEIEQQRLKEQREDAEVEATVGVPIAKSSSTVPMSKRLSRCENKGGYSSGSSAKQKQLGYLELITELTGLGYSANDAESAARRSNSVEAAEEWIRENRSKK